MSVLQYLQTYAKLKRDPNYRPRTIQAFEIGSEKDTSSVMVQIEPESSSVIGDDDFRSGRLVEVFGKISKVSFYPWHRSGKREYFKIKCGGQRIDIHERRAFSHLMEFNGGDAAAVGYLMKEKGGYQLELVDIKATPFIWENLVVGYNLNGDGVEGVLAYDAIQRFAGKERTVFEMYDVLGNRLEALRLEQDQTAEGSRPFSRDVCIASTLSREAMLATMILLQDRYDYHGSIDISGDLDDERVGYRLVQNDGGSSVETVRALDVMTQHTRNVSAVQDVYDQLSRTLDNLRREQDLVVRGERDFSRDPFENSALTRESLLATMLLLKVKYYI